MSWYNPKTIWVSIIYDDGVHDIEFKESTPCRLADGTLCLLKDISNKDRFSIYHGSWESASLTNKFFIKSELKIEVEHRLSDDERQELVEMLENVLNDSSNLNKLKVKYITPRLNRF